MWGLWQLPSLVLGQSLSKKQLGVNSAGMFGEEE
jgi:hypothetical protein